MQLAELNIALLRAPIDDPLIAEFANALDKINALAEASHGFVWRLVGDGNDATSLRPFPDPEMIVNLSVWTDRPSLHNYVYQTAHTPFLRKRAEWFRRIEVPSVVMWSDASLRKGDSNVGPEGLLRPNQANGRRRIRRCEDTSNQVICGARWFGPPAH